MTEESFIHPVLPTEKFPSLVVSRNAIMLQYLIYSELVRALSLVDKCVLMRVCKHGCDVLDSRAF